jgi:hypothetical protein
MEEVRMPRILLAALLALALFPAYAQKKSCDDLKAEIEAKLKAKGVKGYSLDILASAEAKDAKVVGSCDGGTKKIVYKKG